LPVNAGFKVSGEAKNCEKLGSCANETETIPENKNRVKRSFFITNK
jgi:hypothetical protein